jgi:ABC-type multidrug transport system fused ATPase/permease subunit
VLLVGHRLTTVSHADRVALVARGRVVEDGAPRQLGAAGGGYARLVAAWQGTP